MLFWALADKQMSMKMMMMISNWRLWWSWWRFEWRRRRRKFRLPIKTQKCKAFFYFVTRNIYFIIVHYCYCSVRSVCNLSVYRRKNRQYRHNLSWIVQDNRRISRRTYSISILQRVEKYLLEMPQSSTSLQTKTICQHFTESCKIFTTNAIITDIYTDGYSPSTFVGAVHNYRWTVWIPKGRY